MSRTSAVAATGDEFGLPADHDAAGSGIGESVFSPGETHAVPFSILRPNADPSALFGWWRHYAFPHHAGDEMPPVKVPYRIIPSTSLPRAPLALAWEEHLTTFLAEADRAIDRLDAASDRGWHRLSDGERKAIIASLKALDRITDDSTAFVIGRVTKDAGSRNFSEAFVLGQLARLRNTLVSSRVLASFFSQNEIDRDFFVFARDHLQRMTDPFDHLQKSYAIDPFVKAFLTITLPPALPKIDAANPVALRKTIDDIVLRFGLAVEKTRSLGNARAMAASARFAVSVEDPKHTGGMAHLVIRNMAPAGDIYANGIFSEVASAVASRQGIRIRPNTIVIAVLLAADAKRAGSSFGGVETLDDASAPADDSPLGDFVASEESSVPAEQGATPNAMASPAPHGVPAAGSTTGIMSGGH